MVKKTNVLKSIIKDEFQYNYEYIIEILDQNL